MAELQGLCHWPGVQQVVEASISFTHGISPSVATLYMSPQATEIAPSGTLKFTFGDVKIEFPDCRVDEAMLTVGGGGWQWMVSIFDRRWKWRFGSISGNYNLYQDDGEIKAGTEKSPYELAKLCLEAAGEENYDIGSLPGTIRPQVQWQNEVPMEALANLCDQVGCRVVLGLDNKVYVRSIGYGGELPDGYIMEEIGAIDPGETPDEIVIVCGPTRFQTDLELEAVGIEPIGELLPEAWVVLETLELLDDLSYKPSGGWGIPPELLPMAVGDDGDATFMYNLHCAQASVFRYYRVKFPIWVDAAKVFLRRRDEIQLESEQVQGTYQRDSTGDDVILVNLPAEVRGVWYDAQMAGTNVPADTPLGRDTPGFATIGFGLDPKRCLVVTSDYVYKGGEYFKEIDVGAATLILRTAYSVRDPSGTLAWGRHKYTLETGANNGTKPRYIRHDEIVLSYVNGEAQNKAEVDAACIKFANAAMLEYQTGRPYTRKYAGLRIIPLDGAIHNVTWSVGPSGATTVASRNCEQLARVQPYRARRRREHNRRLEREVNEP